MNNEWSDGPNGRSMVGISSPVMEGNGWSVHVPYVIGT